MRKNAGSFRSTVWDPRLIIAQILSIQGFFYASLFIILFVLTAVAGEVNSLNQIYDYRETSLKSRHGFVVFLAFLINAPIGYVSTLLFFLRLQRYLGDFNDSSITYCQILVQFIRNKT